MTLFALGWGLEMHEAFPMPRAEPLNQVIGESPFRGDLIKSLHRSFDGASARKQLLGPLCAPFELTGVGEAEQANDPR